MKKAQNEDLYLPDVLNTELYDFTFRFQAYQFKLFFEFPTMFSKVMSVFQKSNSKEHHHPSKFDHSKLPSTDASQCPFMNKKMNPELQPKSQEKKKPKKKSDDSDASSEEEEKPRGGCPFMKTSEKKRNPNLGLYNDGYDEPFVSKFKYYLSEHKLNLSTLKQNKMRRVTKRETFNKYPIYLQHTLFFTGDDFKKIRTLECCSRFMAYETLREKGNKFYNKGKYYKALQYYERAMSLFRWLEYREPEKMESNLSSQLSISNVHSQEESYESKINLNLSSQEELNNKSEEKQNFDDLQKKYQQFFVVYSDENVAYHNGEEMEEEVDTDMRKSLLIQVYLNMAATYIQLNNFSLAIRVCDDAFDLSERVSQVYMRKTQAIVANRCSTVEQIEKGLQMISQAKQMRKNEKIFQTTNQNILQMINIHDAQQVYEKLEYYVKEKLEERKRKDQQGKKIISDRLVEIYEAQKRIIADGRVPKERKSAELFSETHQCKTILKMREKYMRVLEFYMETKDKQQVFLAKKQFQEVLKVISEIKMIQNIQVDCDDNIYGENTPQVHIRCANYKNQLCEEIVNKGRYNFTVLEWAIKQIINDEQEMLKKEEEKKKEEKVEEKKNNLEKLKEKLPFVAAVALPLVGIAINYAFL